MKNDQGRKKSNKAQPAPRERQEGPASCIWDSGTPGRLFCRKLSHWLFTKKRNRSGIPPLGFHSFLKAVSHVKTKTALSIKLLLLTDAAKIHLLLFKKPLKQSRLGGGIPRPGGKGKGCLPQRP